MKRLISIFLISSIMWSTMNLDELVKTPLLINHYFEHKKSHHDISFLSFVHNHYVIEDKSESLKDEKTNSQLPFKSTISFHSHFVPFNTEIKTINIICVSTDNNYRPYSEMKVLSCAFDIMQPPRI